MPWSLSVKIIFLTMLNLCALVDGMHSQKPIGMGVKKMRPGPRQAQVLYQSSPAAIIKYHNPHDLNKRNSFFFSQFWKARSPRSRYWKNSVSGETFVPCLQRATFSLCPHTAKKERFPLSLFLQGLQSYQTRYPHLGPHLTVQSELWVFQQSCTDETAGIKKAEHRRTEVFKLVLEKTLESPLDNKKVKPVNPKGNQS